MNRRIKLTALVAAGALALAACGGTDDDATETTAAPATTEAVSETTMAPETTEAMTEMDIVDTAVAAGDFTTLAAALDAADLVDTLKGEGPFTVFAPTDAAFEAALADLGLTADELLADTETLTSILTYHVVPGEVPATDVVTLDGQEVETVNGETLTITIDGETVMVDDATVAQADVFASNGVIHVIDSVLLP
ncbi:MAG TPA: fasciclin domain-containing protein [Acidimicrobiia bacterium]|nr:fasciclin domain-containing protein [Acidimicrobiia bacterium]